MSCYKNNCDCIMIDGLIWIVRTLFLYLFLYLLVFIVKIFKIDIYKIKDIKEGRDRLTEYCDGQFHAYCGGGWFCQLKEKF